LLGRAVVRRSERGGRPGLAFVVPL